MSADKLRGSCSIDAQTYKVILHSQPPGAVLLQEPLQQVPSCVWHIGFEHRRLVQDVVVHLSCVATVERGLQRKSERNNLSLFNPWLSSGIAPGGATVADYTYESVEHLVEHRSQTPPVNCAVVRLLLEDFWGQVLWGKQKVNTCPTICLCCSFCIYKIKVNRFVPPVSHRRYLSYHWPQDLLCRGQNLWGRCGPVSPTGCSQASGPCKEEEMTKLEVTPMLSEFNSAEIMLGNVHKGALQDCSSPVHNVQGVEVAKSTCNFRSIEPGSGLQEDPLSLEVVEQLERRMDKHLSTSLWCPDPILVCSWFLGVLRY